MAPRLRFVSSAPIANSPSLAGGGNRHVGSPHAGRHGLPVNIEATTPFERSPHGDTAREEWCRRSRERPGHDCARRAQQRQHCGVPEAPSSLNVRELEDPDDQSRSARMATATRSTSSPRSTSTAAVSTSTRSPTTMIEEAPYGTSTKAVR